MLSSRDFSRVIDSKGTPGTINCSNTLRFIVGKAPPPKATVPGSLQGALSPSQSGRDLVQGQEWG